MVFVCCPESEALKRTKKLENLKDLVVCIENKMKVPIEFVNNDSCCPACCPEVNPVKTQNTECHPPKIMVCYKFSDHQEAAPSNNKQTNAPISSGRKLKKSKSRELRASNLYIGCDCEKRNGLQDDCQRTECHGSPECITKPAPICGPSEFCDGKHLIKIFSQRRKKSTTHGGQKIEENKGGGAGGTNSPVKYRCYQAIIKSCS